MEKDFFKKEIRKMFQFHKSVLLSILKTLGLCVRYGLWLLPWIFFAVFLWKPVRAGWKVLTQDAPNPLRMTQQAPVLAPLYGSAANPGKSLGWETIQNKVDSGVRSFERISRQIRKK